MILGPTPSLYVAFVHHTFSFWTDTWMLDVEMGRSRVYTHWAEMETEEGTEVVRGIGWGAQMMVLNERSFYSLRWKVWRKKLGTEASVSI